MAEFYLTLPSDSSLDYFPENTIAKFTTKLPQHIDLTDGTWEVGLAEISYPYNWNDLNEDGCDQIKYKTDRTGESWISRSVPPIYYYTTEELLKTINKEVIERVDLKHVMFTYDRKDMKARLQLFTPATEFVFLSHRLQLILGFDNNTFKGQSINKADHIVDMELFSHSIYIYSDIAEYTIVGNVMAPLLRIVRVGPRRRGKQVSRSYDFPHYVPVKKKHFDTISIELRDVLGNLVLFERGQAVVVLHFRRKKSTLI